jgi:hypothetical protein
MPRLSTPRSLPTPILKGLPSAPGGSSAPTVASGTGCRRAHWARRRRSAAARPPAAGVDLAHAQPVGLRVRLGAQDLGHDHAAERRRHRAQLFDLHAGHGQQVGQFLA